MQPPIPRKSATDDAAATADASKVQPRFDRAPAKPTLLPQVSDFRDLTRRYASGPLSTLVALQNALKKSSPRAGKPGPGAYHHEQMEEIRQHAKRERSIECNSQSPLAPGLWRAPPRSQRLAAKR
jgi:hypothetical protein